MKKLHFTTVGFDFVSNGDYNEEEIQNAIEEALSSISGIVMTSSCGFNTIDEEDALHCYDKKDIENLKSDLGIS